MLRITIGLSFLVSVALLWHLWASALPRRGRIAYSVLLLLPILGPLAYLWIRNWPSALPPKLMNRFGGISRVFLDRELSRKNNSQSINDLGLEMLAEEDMRREKLKRSKMRRRHYMDRKLKRDDS